MTGADRMHFALTDDQIAVRDMAREFAAEKIAPHALRWDEDKHFPVDVMREAARLIGAQLSIDSSPGSGTRVRLRIPKSAGSAS